MHQLPLHPIRTDIALRGGNVTVHPSAAIAPGVLLQADPGASIVVGAGVCIGMGSILHAWGGTIDIGAGANLGAGVLIVGHSTIGDRACIGTATTVMNAAVASGQIVPPGSLLGDVPPPPAAIAAEISEKPAEPETAASAPAPSTPEASANVPPPPDEAPAVATQFEQATATTQHGRVQLNRLMVKIFPKGHPLHKPAPEEGGAT